VIVCSLTEAAEVRRCLRRLEHRLADADNVDVIRKNFNELICLLDSPLFCRLLAVDNALEALKDQSADENFDIDPVSGELVVLESSTSHHKTDSDSEEDKHIAGGEHEDINTLHAVEVYANGLDEDDLQTLAPGCTIESVNLDKPDAVGIGLGFGIVGLLSDSAELGVYIQSIQSGGVADK